MIDSILQWFLDAWSAFLLLLEKLVNTFFDMFKDLFYWLFDSVLGLAITLLDSLGGSLTWNPASYIADLPPDMTNMIGAIGIGEAISIIGAAIVIRIFLQLIPFVRLGS